MIRLIRRLGRFPAGATTDYFDAAAEAAFLLDGTAERVEQAPGQLESSPEADGGPSGRGYAGMKKDELLKAAMARGLEVSPRAKVREIVDALEADDADA